MSTAKKYTQKIREAFDDHQDLLEKILSMIRTRPGDIQLFEDIAIHALALKSEISLLKLQAKTQPASKKRKLDANGANAEHDEPQKVQAGNQSGNDTSTLYAGHVAGSWADPEASPYIVMENTSFSTPQRKKLRLEFTEGEHGGIRAVKGAHQLKEFGVGRNDIEQIFCLPVPDKSKPQHNIVVIPRYGDGITTTPEDALPQEAIVWTCEKTKDNPDEPETTVERVNGWLGGRGKVVLPDEEEFVSSIVQAHRKDEKAYHVKAFRGSKEGVLFFTSAGILFGFKKPLLYFPFSSVHSVSYTSVLQRTFNLVISTSASSDASSKPTDFEFGMIDQADYSGIDDYIKRHGLNDASLAAERKAKKLNINPEKKTGGENNGDDGQNGSGADAEGEDGETELQKAERELQDQEDEEEEDYDPDADGGDSDGSGGDEDEDEEAYEGADGEEIQEEVDEMDEEES